MGRSNLVRLYAVVLTTLADVPSAPAGTLYAGLMAEGFSFDEFQTVTSALVASGDATRSGHVLTITDKGRTLAAEVMASLNK